MNQENPMTDTTVPGASSEGERPDLDLPPRIVVGKNGAYWRDFGDHYSMVPVSEDNDPVEVDAAYIPSADVEWLVDDAIRAGRISVSRGAEILGITIRAMRDVTARYATDPTDV